MSDETQKKKLLIVDDEKYITQLLSELLESDYTVDSAADGIQAFNKIKNEKFDLMLTDINMPNLDGLQLLRLVRESHPDTMVIMMSGLATTDNVIDALNSGAAYFLKKPFKIEEIHKIIKQKLGSVSDSSKPAVSGVTNDIEALITDINYLILSNNYGNMNDIKKILPGCAELYRESLSDERVVKLLKRIKKFDDAIYRHSLDVGIIASIICSFKRIKPETLLKITTSGFLHDVGKINVDYNILNKSEKLTPEEFDEIKMHTFYGNNILLEENFSEEIAGVAFKHHEKFDGSGYPRGYTEYGIDAYSQFISVCDIFSALTEKRPYRKKLTPQEALEVINKDFQNKINFEIVKLLQLFIEG